MKNEERRMKNSGGMADKGVIMKGKVGLKGWRGSDAMSGNGH